MIVLIGFILAGATQGLAMPTAEKDGCIYSTDRSFRIPLELSNEERQKHQKVRVYVSENDGKTWRCHADSPISATHVVFRGDKDGSYWFGVVLVDDPPKSQAEETQELEPGLKVVIDTQPPKLALVPIRNKASGKKGVRWEKTDDHLAETAPRLAAWDENKGVWEPLAVTTPELNRVWFEDGANITRVQAAIKDKAGNEMVEQVELTGEKFVRQRKASFVLGEAHPPKSSRAAMKEVLASENPESMDPLPPAAVQSEPGKVESVVQDHRAAAQAAVATLDPAAPPAVKRALATEAPTKASPVELVSHAVEKPPAETKEPKIPAVGAAPQLINYEVENQDGMPIQRIELWRTLDDGKTWKLLAVDQDCKSPIEVRFEEDGRHGLSILAVTELRPSAPPAAGAPPEMIVDVDRSPPEVEIVGPKIQAGQLLLEWKVRDARLHPTPITMSYATAVAGPWKAIVVDFPNAGEYIWNYTREKLTGKVYLRLDVKDAVGNVQIIVTREPINLEPPAPPKVKLLSVEPKGSAPE